MYFNRLVMGLGLIALLSLITGYRMYTSTTVRWPDFGKPLSAAPAVVVQVERDYGYRTGDVVPVEIFLQERPGTKLDLDSLVFEGDFEVRGEAAHNSKTTPDGTIIHHIKVDLQSLVIQDKLESGLSFVWESLADKKSQTWRSSEALIKISTSQTWDGRPDIRRGKRRLQTGFHWIYSGLLLAVPLFVLGWCRWVIIRYERHGKIYDPAYRRYVNPVEELRKRLTSTWQQVTTGSTDIQLFTELNADLRKLFGIQTVPVENLTAHMADNSLAEPTSRVISRCEQVTFGHKQLSQAELDLMNQDLVLILNNQKSS